MNTQTYYQTISNSMTEARRPDGTAFIRISDDAPEWVREAVYAAHGGLRSDDTRYRMISELAEAMISLGPDNIEDEIHEVIDGLVPIYTHELTAWLASNNNRPRYCDQATGDGLTDGADTLKLMQCGFYMELQEVWSELESFRSGCE